MSGGKYAATSTVPAGRSREEIERTLTRYGATGFLFGQDPTGAMVAFTLRDRHVRFVMPLPDPNERRFLYTEGSRMRTATAAEAAWQQAVRSRWRALAMIVKAKLEAVDAGAVTFEAEFLAQTVLPDGRTVAETVTPQLTAALAGHTPLALLPGSGS